MGQVMPRHFFYAAVVFTMLISGMIAILAMVIQGNGGDGDTAVSDLLDTGSGGLSSKEQLETWNRTFNLYDQLSTNVSRIKKDLTAVTAKDQSLLQQGVSLPVVFIQTAWATVKFIFTGFGFINSAIEGMAAILQIPSWIPSLIILLITLMFIFSVISLIFGKDF